MSLQLSFQTQYTVTGIQSIEQYTLQSELSPATEREPFSIETGAVSWRFHNTARAHKDLRGPPPEVCHVIRIIWPFVRPKGSEIESEHPPHRTCLSGFIPQIDTHETHSVSMVSLIQFWKAYVLSNCVTYV